MRFTESEMNRFSYPAWLSYLEKNSAQRLTIDFSRERKLSLQKLQLIAPSIRAFQKGEGSDGKYLLRIASAYAQKSGAPEYVSVMRQFVREENWHSAYLKKFMDHYHIKPSGYSVLDGVFRKLRRAGGLKCEIMVLVTAEMIALTYYDALFKATDSEALKSICRQMLHDELPHIMLQSYTLKRMHMQGIDRQARILLMEATLFFVWVAFHRVYRAGGYNLYRYLKENLGYLHQSDDLTKKTGHGRTGGY